MKVKVDEGEMGRRVRERERSILQNSPQELAPTAVNLKDNEGRTSESLNPHTPNTALTCSISLCSPVALHLAVAAGNVPVIEALVCSQVLAHSLSV